MSFAINNPPTIFSLTNVGFFDLFPTGLAYVSTRPNLCGGTLRIKLVCLGTAGHPRIDVDAFVVLA
jgi:hypothetical protein